MVFCYFEDGELFAVQMEAGRERGFREFERGHGGCEPIFVVAD